MLGVMVDSCVLLDIFTDDEKWYTWSKTSLGQYRNSNSLYINSVVYTEISLSFDRVESIDFAIKELGIKVLEMPREALFLTGRTFLKYKQNNGKKTSALPDFFIGSHALVKELHLMTRDVSKYKTYFPNLPLIHPSY